MIELRELKSADIFPMVGILNKIGFKEFKEVITPERFKEMMTSFKADEKEDVDKSTVLGFSIIMEVAGIILGNIPSCEQDLNRFLSGLSGLSIKEISEIPPADYANMIIDVLQKPEFKDFFKAVSRLFN